MKEIQAFSPGHLTGFFQACDKSKDPLLRGSKGAGLSISEGVTTKVKIRKSRKKSVNISINGKREESALVSRHVAESFLRLADENFDVLVEHYVAVPVGCGFGTSGAGALSLALSLNKALGLGMSRVRASQLAHVAEVECKTGLGTVIAETLGGLELREKPGAPGIGQIKSIPISGDYIVPCISFGPLPTSEILRKKTAQQRINESSPQLIEELKRHATPENFMRLSRKFAEHMKLITERLRAILIETDYAGFACSMAMFGETLFSIVKRDQVKEIREIFSRHASSKCNLIFANIDFEGARLL